MYYSNTKCGAQQRSVLGPILFNIDIWDIILLNNNCDVASYADDNMPYTSNLSEDLVKNKSENFSGDLFKQFIENHLKANPDKYHVLTSTNKSIMLILKAIISIAAIRQNCSE